MSVAVGDRLGPYEIVSRLGAGGMGEVWRGRDTRLDRGVAIKVLPDRFAQDAQLQPRLQREARAISQLNHPHICALYDVGENYLVMELVDGQPLEARIDRGALPLPDVLRYGAQIAEALDRAHAAGIVSELVVKNRKGEVLRTVGPRGFYWMPQVSPTERRW